MLHPYYFRDYVWLLKHQLKVIRSMRQAQSRQHLNEYIRQETLYRDHLLQSLKSMMYLALQGLECFQSNLELKLQNFDLQDRAYWGKVSVETYYGLVNQIQALPQYSFLMLYR